MGKTCDAFSYDESFVPLCNANMADYACTLRHERRSPLGTDRCVGFRLASRRRWVSIV